MFPFPFFSSYLQSEAVVNAGPAVFISPNGPNPIMVQVILRRNYLVTVILFNTLKKKVTNFDESSVFQALPFQVGSSIGSVPMGAVQSGSGLVNGLGAGYIPRRRRIDIQIRRGMLLGPYILRI